MFKLLFYSLFHWLYYYIQYCAVLYTSNITDGGTEVASNDEVMTSKKDAKKDDDDGPSILFKNYLGLPYDDSWLQSW